MNLDVFCYVGLLRFPEQLEAALALLRDEERTQVTSLLASIKDLPEKELLQKWSSLREQEYDTLRRKALEQAGVRLNELTPSLRDWFVSWLSHQDG